MVKNGKYVLGKCYFWKKILNICFREKTETFCSSSHIEVKRKTNKPPAVVNRHVSCDAACHHTSLLSWHVITICSQRPVVRLSFSQPQYVMKNRMFQFFPKNTFRKNHKKMFDFFYNLRKNWKLEKMGN